MKYNIILDIVGEFDLDKTLFCGQAFRWQQKQDKYFAVVEDNYVCAYINDENKLVVQSDKPQQKEYWQKYFALDQDYVGYHNRLCKNETLKKCVQQASGIRVLTQPFFETLISFIISQNNNIPRITKIIDLLCKNFGNKINDEFYTFPTAQVLSELSLEDLQVIRSGFRAKYILDAAQKVASGEVCYDVLLNQDYQDAFITIQKIKGVGPKVADCVLLFSAEKKCAFPKDVWIKKAMEQLFADGLPAEAEGIEGIAQQYIFEYIRKN